MCVMCCIGRCYVFVSLYVFVVFVVGVVVGVVACIVCWFSLLYV